MDYTNDFLEKAANIIDAALALKSSIEKQGYQYKDGMFLKTSGKTYCVCKRNVPTFEFKKGFVYEFGGLSVDMDYIVVVDGTDTYFDKDEFKSCFRMASDDETARGKPAFLYCGETVAWQDIPLYVRKHDYPYYFDKEGNDCFPEIVR